jgi:hypothetical protein
MIRFITIGIIIAVITACSLYLSSKDSSKGNCKKKGEDYIQNEDGTSYCLSKRTYSVPDGALRP